MNQFEALTKYIPLIEQDMIGEWNMVKNDNGSLEQLPYVGYSETVEKFIRDIHDFVDEKEDLNLFQYWKILEDNNIEPDSQSIMNADISSLDGQCVTALIVAVIRADRFSEGTLLRFLKEGYITTWLKRLKEIDNA